MTIQELFLLHNLRKAQQQEDQNVEIDELNSMLSTANVPDRDRIDIAMPHQWSAIDNMLHDLERHGYLEILPKEADDTSDHVHLTHRGYHPLQIWWNKFCTFLFRSILVPIIVAIVTAYLTVKFGLS